MSLGWVAHGPFNESTAASAVRSVAPSAGVEVADLRLIRMGENAVFRAGEDVVVRVARSQTDRQRTLDVARWLESAGFPAVRLLDVPQLLRAGGCAVSFWRSLGSEAPYGSTADLGLLLRDLHRLPLASAPGLPVLDPFAMAAPRLDTIAVPDSDREFLRSRLVDMQTAYASLVFDRPPVVLHGDATIYNVLRDPAGVPTLIDLDDFALGPREWDLTQTAQFHERFGWHTSAEYAGFVEAYGDDVRSSPAYETLADIHEFQMVTWLAQQAGDSAEVAAEVSARIESLRTGGTRRTWHPY